MRTVFHLSHEEIQENPQQETPQEACRQEEFAGRNVKPAERSFGEHKLAELKQRLLEISDLGAVGSVLGWDEATYMPKGGAAARGRQSAAMLAHARMSDRSIPRSAG